MTIPANVIKAPIGALCQEASAQSRETYIPCNAPAEYIVQTRDTDAYTMCEACAFHNVKNRGAHYVVSGDTFKIATIEMPKPEAAPVAPAPAAPQLSLVQVQQGYMAAKEALDVMAKRHSEEMAPLAKRMELCKAWFLDYLNKQNLENAKTEYGMIYKSSVMSATVDPENGWDALLGFVLGKAVTRTLDAIENGAREPEIMATFLSEPSLQLLNRSVNKTAVKEMMDQGVVVPGVKIATIVNVNVRKA